MNSCAKCSLYDGLLNEEWRNSNVLVRLWCIQKEEMEHLMCLVCNGCECATRRGEDEGICASARMSGDEREIERRAASVRVY